MEGGGPVGEGNAGKVWDEWGNLCLLCKNELKFLKLKINK